MSSATPSAAPGKEHQPPGDTPVNLDVLHDAARRIAGNVESVIVGKPEVVRTALVTLLAEGHLLVEDVPGVGKTSLAKALARSIDCSVSRIQFTPDLLPSDITGVNIYNRHTGDFEFRPGPVFANVVVGDEINRASPKTQSALLECMEEGQVTIDGTTYPLAAPFMVIATQNPIELEGTYALPEAQRDRFTAKVSIGYPDLAGEQAMIDEHAADEDHDDVREAVDSVQRAHLRRVEPELVAQDVGEVFPELVSSMGNDDHLTVDYSGLTAVLIEAVKQLKADNERLRERLDVLEAAEASA